MKQSNIELFNMYILPEKDFIWRVCRKYARSLNQCQEYYNEALYISFIGVHTYKTDYSIRVWLYVIIRRSINKLSIREAQRPKHENFSDIENLSTSLLALDCNTYIGSDYNQFNYTDDLITALEMIRPASKEAILLQQSGFTIKEISKKLFENGLLKNQNLNTVKFVLFAGKHRLREILNRDGKLISTPINVLTNNLSN